MKTETLAALFAVAVLCGSCSDQPKVRCAAARGMFAATYKLVSGTGDCSLLKGDTLGVGTYNGARSDGTPNWDDASMAIQPYSVPPLLTNAPAPMAGDSLFSLGHFTSAEPNGDQFCDVPTLTVTRVRFPAAAQASMDAAGRVICPGPAQDVQYEWSNVRVVVSAAKLGTEFGADLKYTANGCTATYRVWAVSPAVPCAGPIPEPPVDDAGTGDAAEASAGEAGASDASAEASTDASRADASNVDASNVDASRAEASSTDANPDVSLGADAGAIRDAAASDAVATVDSAAGDAATADDGGGSGALPPECIPMGGGGAVPPVDETLCSPYPNIDKNRPLGSGLSPDSVITCDPALFLCVLAHDPVTR